MSTEQRWKVTAKEAIELQKDLRTQVRIEPLASKPNLIGGCDVSMNRFATEGFAGFVTLSYATLAPEDESVVRRPIGFPYIPGLLSFREIPMLVHAWKKLKRRPDLLFVDGVGIAHPRRLGIASHLGLVLGIPTIGCAKNILTGVYEEPGNEPGSRTLLKDPRSGETLGFSLRTKRNVKPMFISPGHLVGLEQSVDLVMDCVRKHRLPEPTRLAHVAVNAHRRRYQASITST